MAWAPAGLGQRTVLGIGIGTTEIETIQFLIPSSAAWPLANLALYLPFSVYTPSTIYEVMWQTGTGAADSLDIGIYDEAGTRLVSLGSTSTGTASAYNNSTTFTNTEIFPGLRYYLAMACNATHNLFGVIPAAGLLQAMGVMEQASAFPLPATATFAITTRAYVPAAVLNLRTIAL